MVETASALRSAPTIASRKPRVRWPGAAWLLLLLCAAFAFAEPAFASGLNLRSVLMQAVVLLMLALPMTLIVLTEGLDLSMGAALSLCTVVLAATQIATDSLMLGLAAALLTATAVGLLNGGLVAMLGLPPFVVTLGTLGIAQGLALLVSQAHQTMGVSAELRFFWEGSVLQVPLPIWMAAMVWAALHLLLNRARYGARIRALGGNRETLRFAGLHEGGALLGVYAIAGACVGIASVLMTARMNGGHSTAAIGMEFDAVAAVAVGGTALRRGRGGLGGTVLGVLVIAVMRNGLSLLSMPASLQVAAVGLIVIAALWLDAVRGQT